MTGFAKSIAASILIFTLPLLGAVSAYAQSLNEISVTYTIKLASTKYGKATLGKVTTELLKSENGYSVSSATKAQGIAAILMGSNYQEACEFEVDDYRAVSSSYAGGRKKLDDYEVKFDWDQRKVNFSDGESFDMPQGYVVDNCNMLFAIALLGESKSLDESLYIVDGKNRRIRGYRLKSTSYEELDTEFGEFNTRKIVFERELKPERTLTFWLSPEHSYVPLKMMESRNKRTTTFFVDDISS